MLKFDFHIWKCFDSGTLVTNRFCGTCLLVCCYSKLKSRVDMLFFRIEEKNSMCHFKEIENVHNNFIFIFGGTEPPFRANLIFGYAQSGSEQTSILGSTVRSK